MQKQTKISTKKSDDAVSDDQILFELLYQAEITISESPPLELSFIAEDTGGTEVDLNDSSDVETDFCEEVRFNTGCLMQYAPLLRENISRSERESAVSLQQERLEHGPTLVLEEPTKFTNDSGPKQALEDVLQRCHKDRLSDSFLDLNASSSPATGPNVEQKDQGSLKIRQAINSPSKDKLEMLSESSAKPNDIADQTYHYVSDDSFSFNPRLEIKSPPTKPHTSSIASGLEQGLLDWADEMPPIVEESRQLPGKDALGLQTAREEREPLFVSESKQTGVRTEDVNRRLQSKDMAEESQANKGLVARNVTLGKEFTSAQSGALRRDGETLDFPQSKLMDIPKKEEIESEQPDKGRAIEFPFLIQDDAPQKIARDSPAVHGTKETELTIPPSAIDDDTVLTSPPPLNTKTYAESLRDNRGERLRDAETNVATLGHNRRKPEQRNLLFRLI